MINKLLLQKRFSTNARTYDQYASVQKKMASNLLHLNNLNSVESEHINILEVGCGTGRLTEHLCSRFPNANIDAIDLAQGMLDIAKQRTNSKHVTFSCGDIEEMKITKSYDLIISNATFQWFNHFERTLTKLYERLNPNGLLTFSTFGSKTFTELHTSFLKAKEKLGYTKNSAPGQEFYHLEDLSYRSRKTLDSTQTLFTVDTHENLEIEQFPTVRDFFHSVKKIGANNSNSQSYCQSPSLFKEMIRNYEKDFKNNGQISATYHCLYISIQKIL